MTIIKCALYPIRTFLRLIRDIDGLITSLVYRLFPQPYEISGTCKKRGLCCQNIAVYIPNSFLKHTILVSLIKTWYVFVYNFEYINVNHKENVLLFKCNYLKEKGCSIYWKRPFICRNYPNIAQFFKRPTFIPGCGYTLKKELPYDPDA